ncbi:cytochrome c3 family protein [Sphingomonas canadensis]|uniref:Cytochrome c3 family protein n=1 Tax=Sphingomonas canadensis TaxID=1219257 RepID=A0ABW3H8X5_9SPHN|nr:cytochrome c3 family protein [Sphingomonas canadensis]MCW3837381.1 cytochrome c3 family protein [Sphingomonas canadensis]
MTFLIRTISFTADHREIVRETRVAADAVTIGRAAENDVALPDLAVEPQHARMTIHGRRVQVSALSALGFEVDGRSQARADIDAGKGAEIGLGGHRITIGLAPDGAVTLTVRRVDAISDAEEEREEASAFSLAGKLPGRRLTAWLLVAAVLIGFLALPVWGYLQGERRADHNRNIYSVDADASWSSGPLSAAHHALEKNCESCHVQAFVAVRDETCRTCHTDVHDHAPPARIANARAAPGAFGAFLNSVASFFNKPGPGACVDCHSEHEGAGPMQQTAQAFCADCHATLDQRLKDTRLPNAGDFGNAHPEFRPTFARTPGGELIRAALDRPLTAESGLKFPHRMHLDKAGGVARMGQNLGLGAGLDCADCHKPTADGVRFLPVDMESNCGSCHSLAYDRVGDTVRKLRHGDIAQTIADLRARYSSYTPPRPMELGNGRRRPGAYAQGQVYSIYFGPASRRSADSVINQIFASGGACSECHTVTGGYGSWSVAPVSQPSRYMLHGWFDHGAHKTEDCATCHKADASDSSSDLLLPGIKTCRTCHGGEAASSPVPSSCAMCHSYHSAEGAPWRPGGQAARQGGRARGGGT